MAGDAHSWRETLRVLKTLRVWAGRWSQARSPTRCVSLCQGPPQPWRHPPLPLSPLPPYLHAASAARSPTMFLALALVLSYLAGSIPTSVWVGRAVYGLDVRVHGSGNAGATNVYRVLGWKAGVFVLLFDAFKGWFAASVLGTLAMFDSWAVWGGGLDALEGSDAVVAVRLACGVAAILGHTFPLFAGFKGGKGVATTAGVLIALTPGALALTLVAFLAAAAPTRLVAVGSLTAAVVYPSTLFVQRFVLGRPVSTVLLVVGTAMGAWLFWTHRGNIARLVRGEETKLVPGQRVRGFDNARSETSISDAPTSSTP